MKCILALFGLKSTINTDKLSNVCRASFTSYQSNNTAKEECIREYTLKPPVLRIIPATSAPEEKESVEKAGA